VQSAAASKNISTSSLPSLNNIGGVKDAIMSKLSPTLGLTAATKTAVSTDVTDYLKKKATIMPLANTDKTAYASKSSSLVVVYQVSLKPRSLRHNTLSFWVLNHRPPANQCAFKLVFLRLDRFKIGSSE